MATVSNGGGSFAIGFVSTATTDGCPSSTKISSSPGWKECGDRLICSRVLWLRSQAITHCQLKESYDRDRIDGGRPDGPGPCQSHRCRRGKASHGLRRRRVGSGG